MGFGILDLSAPKLAAVAGVSAAILAASSSWYITSEIYEGKIATKRAAWAKDIADNKEAARLNLEAITKSASESCAQQLTDQQGACNETQKSIVANCSRTHDMLNSLRRLPRTITASCGVLQAGGAEASGYDPESGRFWVDAEAVADLATIAGIEANNFDAATTLDAKWPKP